MADFEDRLILIVDDTPENIDIISNLLTDFKMKVATNGPEALEKAGTDPKPDLILLDINMPEMDGFEVCRRLKDDENTKDIPVIFLTAQTGKETTIEGFKLGARDYITKPFDPGELMQRVKTQLELREKTERLETLISQMDMSNTLLKQSNEEITNQKNLIEEERAKADKLLLNILPKATAEELKKEGRALPKHYNIATVLFSDLVDFTKRSKELSPQQIVDELNVIFQGIDEILEKHNLEKIKTIGDGYMAAGGIPLPNGTNPTDAVNAGLEIIELMKTIKKENEKNQKPPWEIRVGIHTGELIAGVIGKSKFAFDVWGETVNIASRMESSGEPGRVNVSGITYQLVKDKFNCESRGNIAVKNMGKMDMYFVNCKL